MHSQMRLSTAVLQLLFGYIPVPLLSWKSGSDAYRRRYHNDVNAHLLRLWESLHGYHHPHDCEKVAMNQGNGKAQDAIPALPTSATTSTLSLRIAQRLVPSVESAKQLVRSTSPLPYPMTGQSKLHVQRLPPFAFAASVRYTKDSADLLVVHYSTFGRKLITRLASSAMPGPFCSFVGVDAY